MSDPVYLDHNASTPVLPRVREAVDRALRDGFGNPSAGHVPGRRARAFVDRAREEVARLLGCSPGELLFTGGGTESNNLALLGWARAVAPAPVHLVVSTIEHPAVLGPAALLAERGATVATVGPLGDGAVVPHAVAAALPGRGAQLVSVMLAQNETGVLQDVAAIARACRPKGAVVHTDAAQAVGKIRVRVGELGVDLLSVAGHKLHAPKGVGALYVRAGTPLAAVLAGAGHERGLRPGTENVPGIAGLGEACAQAFEDLELEAARQLELRRALEDGLAAAGFVVHGGPARLPNTVNGRFPGVAGSALLQAVPELAFTTGSACHAGHEEPSSVLSAMGLAREDALGAIRLSLGRGTTRADVELACELLRTAAASLRQRATP